MTRCSSPIVSDRATPTTRYSRTTKFSEGRHTMREFVVPKTDTKIQGEVKLEYAFLLRAKFDPARRSRTPKGDFRYQDITSGDVRGERLNATVYADSGGQYDTIRADRVRDV